MYCIKILKNVQKIWIIRLWSVLVIYNITICNCLFTTHRFKYYPIKNINHRELEIRSEIKEALRYADNNETLQKIIPEMFNLASKNPTYTFILPGEEKRQLVVKKSDFLKATFPILTEAYIQLSRMSLKDFSLDRTEFANTRDPNKTDSIGPSIKFGELNKPDSSAVVRNVQTERNFIRYMEDLNEKGASFSAIMKKREQELNPTNHDLTVSDTKNSKKYIYVDFKKKHFIKNDMKESDEWEKLGLSGWKGSITSIKDFNFDNIDSTSEPATIEAPVIYKSKIYPGQLLYLSQNPNSIVEIEETSAGNVLTPLQLNFLDDPNNNDIWDLPGKVSSNLLKIMENGNEAFKNVTAILKKQKDVKWPITSSRNLHKDVDIFIARANDPFGHSTKWKFRNSTDNNDNRKKRAVLELYSMIKCSTGCDPLIFKGYGCFCGFLGSGTPMDGIDQCCRNHDDCYGHTNCHPYLTYFVPYVWKCYHGRPLCAISHGQWGGPGSCAARLCKCDLKLAKCLRQHVCPRRRAVCTSSRIRMIQNVLMIV